MRERLKALLPRRLLELAQDVRWMGLPLPHRVVRPHSMLTTLNLLFLEELARRADEGGVPGDLVECGTYRGGSAGVLGYAAMRSPARRRVRLYDAFEGMPRAGEHDGAHARALEGRYVGSVEQTRRILSRLGVPPERYDVVVGRYEDTLPRLSPLPVALLHVDCDFYEPVKLVLRTFLPWVSPGGYVVLNDYGTFPGCRRATDEVLPGAWPGAQVVTIDRDAVYAQRPRP